MPGIKKEIKGRSWAPDHADPLGDEVCVLTRQKADYRPPTLRSPKGFDSRNSV